MKHRAVCHNKPVDVAELPRDHVIPRGTIAIGVVIGRRIKTGSEFFLAGRQLPWWVIGMSLVATGISGTDIIGVGGAAFSRGMAVANFERIGCVPAMIAGAFIFIPFYYRSGASAVAISPKDHDNPVRS